MDKVFDISPLGNVKISYSWNNKDIQFESTKKQYLRRRIKPLKIYSFTVAGLDLRKLVSLYKDCHGTKDSFKFTYDGVTEDCHFAQAINPQVKRENGIIKAYSCDVVIEVESQKTNYPAPKTNDVLPNVYSDTQRSYDWETTVVSLGQSKRYRAHGKKAKEKISGKWCGIKQERDKIISLFNSHCKIPLKFKFNGEILNVRLPDKIEIIDHRELKRIVGYECQMELEVI